MRRSLRWPYGTITRAHWPRTARRTAGAKTIMVRPRHPTTRGSPRSRRDSRTAAVSGNRTDRQVCWGYGGDEPDGRFIAISAGRSHTCAIRADGSPECWGGNVSGSSTPPADERFTSIGSGNDYSCGLRMDGTVRCWGEERYHGSHVSPENERFTMISIGSEQACGVRVDGSVLCWGDRARDIPSNYRFSSVSIDTGHACGLLLDGSIACWGTDHNGQTSPPWGKGATFIAVAVGSRHSCAVRTDGEIVCWGSDYDGQSSPPGGERYEGRTGRYR